MPNEECFKKSVVRNSVIGLIGKEAEIIYKCSELMHKQSEPSFNNLTALDP